MKDKKRQFVRCAFYDQTAMQKQFEKLIVNIFHHIPLFLKDFCGCDLHVHKLVLK